MSNINNENEIPAFDLFAPPAEDNLQEELAKGQYQWTNKYTKFLAGMAIVVTLLSAGAWYGHHSATSSTTSASAASLRGALGGSGFAGVAGFAGATGGTRSGAGATGGIGGGGGFGGTRITGTIASVSGNKVTITLDDPTAASSLKSGDAARVTDTAGFGAPAAGALPNSATTKSTTPRSGTTSSKSTATQKPAVGGATGGRGFFNDPTIQACLTKEGVSLTPGVRPDRTDPKVAAAFAKCLPGFGSGGGAGGAGGGFGGARPSGAPTPAPSN